MSDPDEWNRFNINRCLLGQKSTTECFPFALSFANLFFWISLFISSFYGFNYNVLFTFIFFSEFAIHLFSDWNSFPGLFNNIVSPSLAKFLFSVFVCRGSDSEDVGEGYGAPLSATWFCNLSDRSGSVLNNREKMI